jgi:hypothetical protein
MQLPKFSITTIDKILKLFGNKVLIIYLNEVHPPFFTLWKWSKDDYKKDVELEIDGVKVLFRLGSGSLYSDDSKLPDRNFAMYAHMFIIVENPTQELLDGLNNKSDENEIEAANTIHSIYKKTIDTLTLHARWHLKIPSILSPHYTSFHEMFYENGFSSQKHVFWRTGGSAFQKFLLKKKQDNKINPLFLSKNLLSVNGWMKLKKYLSSAPELSQNIAELVKIRSKVEWNEKRIPTIETAALIEVVIRNAATTALKGQGVSNTKIKHANDEAGLSILLNMLLPLILTKKEVETNRVYLDRLDALRSVRNKIMHENLPEEDINLEIVEKGINAAIEVTLLLEGKIK